MEDRLVLGSRTLELLELDNIDEIEILAPWYRAGAETYLSRIAVRRNNQQREQLVAKACIKFAAAEVMKEWLNRRKLVQEYGISVPKLVAVDRATLVEEYIPHTLEGIINEVSLEEELRIKRAAEATIQTLRVAGFRPTGIHDLRSRGTDVVMIDFGEDLGGN